MEPVTIDVCEVDFPPAAFGATPAQVEATVQQTIERIFRDADGIMLSGVYGKTMKPLRPQDVEECPDSLQFIQQYAVPEELKLTWHNYENAGQASGKYLLALVEKYQATGDKQVLDWARRLVQAIATLWENAATTHQYGRGWFPKPLAGIHNVKDIYECSADQYADITFGLHAFHRHLADEAEKALIERIILSFAVWWDDRDYAGAYIGRGIWWKRLKYPHPTGYFLYLNALAYSWDPCARFRKGFEKWIEIKDGLTPRHDSQGPNECGIAIDALEQLLDLRPMERPFWLAAAKQNADQIVHAVKIDNLIPYIATRTQVKGYAAHNLAVAHRMMSERGYDGYAKFCIEGCKRREDFYYILRGQKTAGAELMTDESRNTYWCENLVGWLGGYWGLKNAGVSMG
ncbi:MAG: hypothetical protein K8S99_03640 [Planctomycetes bacterium]|nr:hypothetical protein [Planctomycetota bacterium]